MNQLKLAVTIIFLFPITASAVTCYDYKNQYVQVQAAPFLNDGAAARSLSNGQGVILYNPNISKYWSPIMRDFVFTHECAHHALGHGVLKPVNEAEADCWAIKTMSNLGMTRQQLHYLQNEFAASGSGLPSWTHAPAGVRAQRFALCY
ncbi:MAG: hypothetical protein OIF51_19125 [Cellvibrionaceae bacterium]|nr:hypothetical protein [Cellvibrionaceae bacterium]